ncbi:MAG: hypothetical protein V4580_11370, partial [Bacteroidota bacterium]
MKFISTYIYCLLLLLSSFCIHSQNEKIDSLKLIVNASGEDTNKVKTLNLLTWELKSGGEFDLAYDYARLSQALCLKLNYQKGLVGAYMNQGLINAYKTAAADVIKQCA